jgi:hypothetical protein
MYFEFVKVIVKNSTFSKKKLNFLCLKANISKYQHES